MVQELLAGVSEPLHVPSTDHEAPTVHHSLHYTSQQTWGLRLLCEVTARVWTVQDTRQALQQWQIAYLRHNTRGSATSSPVLQYTNVRDTTPNLEEAIKAQEALMTRIRSSSQAEIETDMAEISDMLGNVFSLDADADVGVADVFADTFGSELHRHDIDTALTRTSSAPEL